MNRSIFKIAALGVMLSSGLFPAARAWGLSEESFTLSNGLKVIMVHQPGSPVVSMRVMVRTGAAAEASRSEYGLAHLMEHMAFKGTSRHTRPGLISSLVERNGGDMNAYTSSDSTVYYINMPAEQTTLGLDILSDMIFSPLYDPAEYELEKEVVVEEIKRGRDNPTRIIMENFFGLAYPDHPYGRTVIGYEETVKNVSVKEAKDFHSRHYRPDNCVLVLTGGFNRSQAMEAIEKFFASVKKPADDMKHMPFPALAPPSGPNVKIIESDKVALAKIWVGFRGPKGDDPQTPVLDLVSSIFSDGKASRLSEIIKDQKQLVTDISASSYTPRYQGNFIITMETEPGKVMAAVSALWEELARMVSEPPTISELGRAKALAEKSFVSGQESAQGLAGQITEFEMLFGDWRLRDAYLSMWNRIIPADLSLEASRHFKPKNMTMVVMLPKSDKAPEELNEENLSKLAAKLQVNQLGEDEAAVSPDFAEMKLKNGAKLLVMRDATLPLVSVKAAALGGLLAEDENTNGLSNFMASVWSKATKKRKNTVLARDIEDIGASISGFSGRNSVGLSGSFLSEHREEGLKLFAEILSAPAFDKEDVERMRPEILAQIKAQDEQLASRVFRLLAANLYPGGHPYSRNDLGSKEKVEKFTAGDLKNAYMRLVHPDELLIVVAGDVDPEKIRNYFDELLSGWKTDKKAVKISAPKAPPAINKAKRIAENLERAQTHLAFGFQAPGLGSEESAALDVLAAYLSGMSGPLFRELRDQKSLAYTVHCGYNPGLGIGSFSFYIASDPQKVEAALKGFDEIIERTRTKHIASDELEGAKRYITGTTKIRSQTVASRAGQAMFNVLYNLGLNYDKEHLAAIEKVTAEDVKKAAEKYLRKENRVLAVLGKN